MIGNKYDFDGFEIGDELEGLSGAGKTRVQPLEWVRLVGHSQLHE